MSEIHLPQDKETVIGLVVFIGVAILFVINVIRVTQSLVEVYGAQEKPTQERSIDATALSEAVKILETPHN